MIGKLIFEDKTQFEGTVFGAEKSTSGEVVFSTGMMGYPESLTDPSYKGQILITTYPLVGNYGVPEKKYWESDNIQVRGLIVSTYNQTPSHFKSKHSLSDWLKQEGIPGLEIKDTRFLAQKLRDSGALLGKIVITEDVNWYDPNTENLVTQVSTTHVTTTDGKKNEKYHGKTMVLIDCGAKKNIERCLVKRGVRVITVPWDYNPFEQLSESFDALMITNGPGDPILADKTIQTIQEGLKRKFPILGICLGHQLLGLAAGGKTSKLKFGHRSQNQPCLINDNIHCYITTQNHGFHVSTIPDGFTSWFTNANDGTNEGIIHKTLPIMSVQFHPEASAGPEDTEWIFDYFMEKAFT